MEPLKDPCDLCVLFELPLRLADLRELAAL